MSSEVCPWCGKPFKRLNAHLPHCKAKATPTRHPENPSDDSPSTLTPAASPLKTPARMKKSKASVPLTSSSMMKTTDTEVTSSASSSSSSLSASTKKKKRKLMDEIKQLATQSPSSSTSPPPPPLPPSSTLSKPKKKSLRALVEASRPAAVLSEPQEGTTSISLDRLPVSSSDTLTNTTPQQDTKPKSISKKKSQRAENTTSKASGRSSVEGQEIQVISWEDQGPTTAENRLFEDDPTQSTTTLQGVRASLGGSNTSSRSHKPSSLLEQVQTSALTADTRTKGPVSMDAVQSNPGVAHIDLDANRWSLPVAQSEQLNNTKLSVTQKSLPVNRLSPGGTSSPPDSWQQHAAGSILPAVAPLPSPTLPLTQRTTWNHVKVGAFSHPVSQLAEGRAGAPPGAAPSPPTPPVTSRFSDPVTSRSSDPVTSRSSETLMRANPLLQVNTADADVNRIGGVLAERHLGQVKLRDVPAWLAVKTPSHPAEVIDMLHGGWQWYYRKYINVKKGGVGGVAMLLAGYCALSYMWSYPHIKWDRWRKYH